GFPVVEPRLETSLAKNAPTKLAVSENTSSILLAEPLLAQPATGIATASRPTQTARLILPPRTWNPAAPSFAVVGKLCTHIRSVMAKLPHESVALLVPNLSCANSA